MFSATAVRLLQKDGSVLQDCCSSLGATGNHEEAALGAKADQQVKHTL